MQNAALSGHAFHMNEALNGIPLSTAIHLGSHPQYNNRVLQKLNTFNQANPNASPDKCFIFVNQLIQQVRTAIANNPNIPINQLIF